MFTRVRKRYISSLLILGLAFAQVVVAAYACAKLEAEGAASVQVVAETMPCDQMNMEDVVQADEPVRCLEHCKYGQQNVNFTAPADFPTGVMVALFEAPPLVVAEPPAVLVQTSLLARATAPPEYARSQRLRI